MADLAELVWEARPVASTTRRSLRVLVVDDEPMVRRILQAYLAGDGHVAECVASGPEGLDALRSGVFDLIMTDQSMPTMTGDQFAAAAWALAPDAPVIMLTGYADDLLARGVALAHIDLVLAKPIRPAELREGIAAVMGASDPSPGAAG